MVAFVFFLFCFVRSYVRCCCCCYCRCALLSFTRIVFFFIRFRLLLVPVCISFVMPCQSHSMHCTYTHNRFKIKHSKIKGTTIYININRYVRIQPLNTCIYLLLRGNNAFVQHITNGQKDRSTSFDGSTFFLLSRFHIFHSKKCTLKNSLISKSIADIPYSCFIVSFCFYYYYCYFYFLILPFGRFRSFCSDWNYK